MAISSQPARPAAASRPRLKWATSQQVGGVSELAVLAPIRKGIVPGERRTYEERLRATIANLAKRHQQGIPTELDKVSTIHFGRMIIIRPEQYLFLSRNVGGIEYNEDDDDGREGPPGPAGTFSSSNVLEPLDDFERIDDQSSQSRTDDAPSDKPELRSWLLTLVEFDGELKSYMREIVQFMGLEFDRIFENCELYPRTANFEKFWIWIRTFQITTDLFYAPYRDLSVVRIRQLEAFKRRFDAFVARVRSPTGPLVRSMDELFDEFLRENQQYAAGFPAPGGTYASEDGW
jgi:hypothetical protein